MGAVITKARELPSTKARELILEEAERLPEEDREGVFLLLLSFPPAGAPEPQWVRRGRELWRSLPRCRRIAAAKAVAAILRRHLPALLARGGRDAEEAARLLRRAEAIIASAR